MCGVSALGARWGRSGRQGGREGRRWARAHGRGRGGRRRLWGATAPAQPRLRARWRAGRAIGGSRRLGLGRLGREEVPERAWSPRLVERAAWPAARVPLPDQEAALPAAIGGKHGPAAVRAPHIL